MKWIRTGYFILTLSIVTILAVLISALVHLVSRFLLGRTDGRGVHFIASVWARSLFALTPGWNIVTTGIEHIVQTEPYVIVSNHESMSDIWAMYALGMQFRWLSKAEVFRIPGVGSGMRWAGYVPVVRGDKDSHARAMAAAANWIRRGVSMFFFPEGTRSKTGELLPFRPGAFKLAKAEGVRVLPVAIKGAKDLLPKGSITPGSCTVSITVFAPIAIATGDEPEIIAGKVREMIQNTLKA